VIVGLGPNVSLIPAGQSEYAELAERQRRDTERRERGSVDITGQVERVDPGALQRRVEALQAAESGRLRRQREQQELPRGNQLALDAYQTNQRISNGRNEDGELAGIDLFV
jgi:hypothetical protein